VHPVGAQILLIEDNPDDRSLCGFLLEAYGHDPVLATSVEEGIELARSKRPDAILLDVMLPGLGGEAVLAELRRDRNLDEVPIVAVTVMTSPGQREHLLAAGFDGYIPKPLLPKEFARQLDQHLPSGRRSRIPD